MAENEAWRSVTFISGNFATTHLIAFCYNEMCRISLTFGESGLNGSTRHAVSASRRGSESACWREIGIVIASRNAGVELFWSCTTGLVMIRGFHLGAFDLFICRDIQVEPRGLRTRLGWRLLVVQHVRSLPLHEVLTLRSLWSCRHDERDFRPWNVTRQVSGRDILEPC